MILHARSRPLDDYDAEPHVWTVEAPTYEAAVAEARASVPEGWVLLSVRVDSGLGVTQPPDGIRPYDWTPPAVTN